MANFKKTDKGYSKKTTTPKTKYVQKEIYLGSSDFYNEIIPSLNDLLGKIYGKYRAFSILTGNFYPSVHSL